MRTMLKEVLMNLPKKQQEVIQKRYGLKDGQRRTLEEVGQDYGITRERVRQIEESAFNKLRDENIIKRFYPYFEALNDHLENHGGVRHEDKLISEDSEDFFDVPSRVRPAVTFFILTLGQPFSRFSQNNHFYTLWSLGDNFYSQAQKIINLLVEELERTEKPLPEDEFFYIFRKVVKENKFPVNVNEKIVASYFDISKKIEQNIYGEYGLADWPEINPRGAGEKAYIVLKRIGKPMHFIDLAKKVNQAGFDERVNHFQTIHNELIKDPKFVLIGRGIYALGEWGYQPGTISELLVSILRKSQPLSKDKLVREVKNQRLVKDSTILMSLQNKNLFKNTPRGYLTVS